MTPNILSRIADKRRDRIAREGYGLSCPVPEARPSATEARQSATEARGRAPEADANARDAGGNAPEARQSAPEARPSAPEARGNRENGERVPETRVPAGGQGAGARPLAFLPTGGIVCEIKRRSPSRGDISAGLDPLEQAGLYAERGADAVSVLTEEDHFGGCLADLTAVKERYPDLPLLRKDFLLDVEDVDVSYRAGADAVLLIAALLSPDRLAEMHERAISLGMAALVEVHAEWEVDAVRDLAPPLVGINARDLTTFRVDPLTPLRVRPSIDWEARVVYESGVFEAEQAAVASSAGFDSVLVGEAVVREPERIDRIRAGLAWKTRQAGSGREAFMAAGSEGQPRDFWNRLAARMKPGLPLVKICGITNYRDGAEAVRLGADILGFVFADSKRQATPQAVRACAGLDCLRVAVVVCEKRDGGHVLPPAVEALIAEGAIDAVQFHGDEEPEECAHLAFPYYKALRLRSPDDAAELDRWKCPRVLVDAFSRESRGGTGCMIEPETVAAVADHGSLWLAGGLAPDTIAAALYRHEPELVDASSGLESEPGKKDHAKLAAFFKEIHNA